MAPSSEIFIDDILKKSLIFKEKSLDIIGTEEAGLRDECSETFVEKDKKGWSEVPNLHTGRRSLCHRAGYETVPGRVPLGVSVHSKRNETEESGWGIWVDKRKWGWQAVRFRWVSSLEVTKRNIEEMINAGTVMRWRTIIYWRRSQIHNGVSGITRLF